MGRGDIGYLQTKLDIYIAPQHTSPVSTILLQENSFKPATSAGFFFARVLSLSPLLVDQPQQ
jgi:hypothetical protein